MENDSQLVQTTASQEQAYLASLPSSPTSAASPFAASPPVASPPPATQGQVGAPPWKAAGGQAALAGAR